MSIGVIGGADGPTAVFISSSVNRVFIAGATIVIVGGIIALLILKKKR